MLLALALIAWLDQWLDAQPASEVWRRLFGEAETLPPGLVIVAVGAFVLLFAAWELADLLRAAGVRASLGMTTFAALAGMSAPALGELTSDHVSPIAGLAIMAAAVMLLAVIHYGEGDFNGAVSAAGGTVLAFVYLGLLFGFLLMLRFEHSAWLVLGVIVVTKSGDIGAYLAGKTIGRHKLAPSLSPGKTWEGLAGGVALASASGALAAWAAPTATLAEVADVTLPVWGGALTGAALALAGQGGDLTASVLKRDAGAKDASALLPGFGGVLDVLDSLLLAAPAAYWILWWLARNTSI